MPPKPSPARNRNAPSDHGFGANADRSIITENHTSEAMKSRRLPSRSVRGPVMTAPMIAPTRA
jgi:hypothetical protein